VIVGKPSCTKGAAAALNGLPAPITTNIRMLRIEKVVKINFLTIRPPKKILIRQLSKQ
jgi:hypothetical protein